MKLALALLLLPVWLCAQTDTTCGSLPDKDFKACMAAKEPAFRKAYADFARRKGDTLRILLAGKPALLFVNEAYDPAIQTVDTSRTYFFIQKHKTGYATVLRIAADGNSYLLINLASGETKAFDGLPQFSPSGSRLLVVSGSLHCPFSPEMATVWKRSGKTWVQEYKSEPKPLEGYGHGRWTSDSRIVLQKLDWEKSSGGKPQSTETILLYEYSDWRRVNKNP